MSADVVEGDIAAIDVDAVANAADNHLWMEAAVFGEEASRLRGCGGSAAVRKENGAQAAKA